MFYIKIFLKVKGCMYNGKRDKLILKKCKFCATLENLRC